MTKLITAFTLFVILFFGKANNQLLQQQDNLNKEWEKHSDFGRKILKLDLFERMPLLSQQMVTNYYVAGKPTAAGQR
jgi:vacuolar-type H+-ATPase subunit B/Vma2